MQQGETHAYAGELRVLFEWWRPVHQKSTNRDHNDEQTSNGLTQAWIGEDRDKGWMEQYGSLWSLQLWWEEFTIWRQDMDDDSAVELSCRPRLRMEVEARGRVRDRVRDRDGVRDRVRDRI